MQRIDYGLGILRASVLATYPADRNFDLETVYKDLVGKDQLAGFEVRARFYEIGSLAGLEETRLYLNKNLNHEDLKDFEENKNALRSLRSSWFKSSLALWVETHFAVSASQ